MKQEFVTVRGKVIMEDDSFVVRNRKPRDRSDFFFLTFFLFYALTKLDDNNKQRPLALLFLGFLSLYGLFLLIELFFINAWRDRIRYSDIKSFRTVPDEYGGLEVIVKVYLRNGRQKTIPFRTLEKQHEPFLELLGQQVTQVQMA